MTVLLTFALGLIAATEVTPMPTPSAQIVKVDAHSILVTATFAVPRQRVFDALTRPEHQTHWMSASGFSLATSEVDGRPGGRVRYVYERASGKRIEVRGAYQSFDPPSGYSYTETYDFSPLRIEVTVTLEETDGTTRYEQMLRYASERERDEDFEGVATSTRESMAKLSRYLEETPQWTP
jgi:uncharacterized protein YndB with AHSA1/START domain